MNEEQIEQPESQTADVFCGACGGTVHTVVYFGTTYYECDDPDCGWAIKA